MNARVHRASLTGGAVTPWVSERFDTERHATTANGLRNAIALPQGPVIRRPGFVAHSTPATTGEHRIIPFHPSDADPVLLVLTDAKLTHPGGTVDAPWLDALGVDLWEVQAIQVGDTVLFTHGKFAPQWLRLVSGSYYFGEMPWDWPALRDENTSQLEFRVNRAGAMGEIGDTFVAAAYSSSAAAVDTLRTESGKVWRRLSVPSDVPSVAPLAWEAAEWIEARAPFWVDAQDYQRGDVVMVESRVISGGSTTLVTTFYRALEAHKSGSANYPPDSINSIGPDALNYWEPAAAGWVGTPTVWAAGTAYTTGALVGTNVSGTWYNVWRCIANHSSVFKNSPPVHVANSQGVTALFYAPWSAVLSAGPITYSGAPEIRSVPTLNLDWGTSGPGGAIPSTYFAARFFAWIVPPTTGNYRLRISSQDGHILIVNGATLNADVSYQASGLRVYTSGALAWTAGVPVPVLIEYTQHISTASLRLEWEVPAGSFADIPADKLFTSYAPGASSSSTSGADYAKYWLSFNPFSTGDVRFALYHTRTAQSVRLTLSGNAVSDPLRVIGGWAITTTGSWAGTIRLERQQRSGSWETIRTWTRALGEQNITLDGREEPESNLRVTIEGASYSGSTAATVFLEASDARIPGLVRVIRPFGRYAPVEIIQAPLSSDWTTYHAEGAYSQLRGYPAAACIHAQRLLFGGGKAEPLTLRGSVIGDLFNFRTGVADDAAFAFTLAGTQVSPIQWMHSGQRLFLGTELGEWSLSGSNGGPESTGITATNVDAVQQSEYGSAYRQPVSGGDTILFLQRGRREIRELQWAGADAQSTAPRLTVLGGHLTRGRIRQWGQAMHPLPLIWCVTDEGQLLSFTFERDQNVVAWARHDTPDGLFESLAVVRTETRDELYVVVNRSGTRTIERLHWESFEAIEPAGNLHEAPTSVPSGMVWADIGGAFRCEVVPQRIDLQAPNGSSQGKEFRCSEVALRLWRTAGDVSVKHAGSTTAETKPLGVLAAGAGARVTADDRMEAGPSSPQWAHDSGSIPVPGISPTPQLFTGELVVSPESRPSRFLDLIISHESNAPFILMAWNPKLIVA